LIAQDASEKTKEPIKILCKHHNVVCIECFDKYDLGVFTGKNNRATVAVADKNFANRIIELLENKQ